MANAARRDGVLLAAFNQLVVDGRTIAHGTRQFYDEESCPAQTGMQANLTPGETVPYGDATEGTLGDND